MLALVLGSGRVPVHLARALSAAGREFEVLHLDGFEPDPDAAPEHLRQGFRIEHLGSLLADLRAAGVTEVAFAGAIGRPPLEPAQIDPATMPLVPAMMAALQSGDDAALRAVIGFFEEAGMTVRAPEDLAPDLLPASGVLTRAKPSDGDRSDIARAAEVVVALGAADVGQGAVVAGGLVLAVEALPGTDAMLAALGALRRVHDLPDGGVLWKAPKPGQDLRIDRPTIGPGTVAAAIDAGLNGISVPANAVLFPDSRDAVAAADAAGMFIWVKERE